LQQQIAQVKPQIILAMGTFAVQAVLGSTEPVGKLRGRVHRCQGLPVIVTYDPAFLLRSPADKAGAWVDLCLARDTLARAADLP
jgi:DNA polymerase